MTTPPIAFPNMQRGACPALSAPMMTGDGLLARIALTDAISLAQLAELCRLARRHGNGMLDISARGNLQVRGLTEVTAPLLDVDVRALNLPLRDGLAVETPALAGLDHHEVADPRPLADAIRKGAQDITGLAPKMSVVVDGHGRLRLSGLLADIRLVAVRAGGEVFWKVMLGGTEESGFVFSVLRETQAADAAIGLLRRLSEIGPKARGSNLAEELYGSREKAQREVQRRGISISPLVGEITGSVPHHHSVILNQSTGEPTASPFGTFSLSQNLHATGVGPAFGQTTAENLITLCEAATHLGIKSVKPAFDHSLIFFGNQTACEALSAFAAAHGFITSTADPRGHIAACPGSPACASANIPTHEIATQAAAECADLLDGSFKLHVTGCPKGCAHPQASALALCGSQTDLSFIHQGKAADQPFAAAAFADTNATLRRLADLVTSQRRAGETSAACLARLRSERLAVTVSGRP